MCSQLDDMTNPFLAEPGTHPHDGTTQFYSCGCRFCCAWCFDYATGLDPDPCPKHAPKPTLAPELPIRQFGGWVHLAVAGTLPTFSPGFRADAYLPDRVR